MSVIYKFCTKLECLLEKLGRDKHFILLQKLINYAEKSFMKLPLGANVKNFFVRNLRIFVIS